MNASFLKDASVVRGMASHRQPFVPAEVSAENQTPQYRPFFNDDLPDDDFQLSRTSSGVKMDRSIHGLESTTQAPEIS